MIALALLAACARPLPADGWLDSLPAGPPCDGEAARIERVVDVRVLVSDAVDAEVAQREVRRAATTWASYGVTLHLAGPPTRTPVRSLLIDAPADSPPETLLAPARALALRPARDEVTLALLPHLMDPGSPARGYFTELRGLTLLPGVPPWDEALGADPFTPAAVVAVDEPPPPGHLPLTGAHELGHALGLPHATVARDLMNPAPQPCVPWLTAAELTILERRPR